MTSRSFLKGISIEAPTWWRPTPEWMAARPYRRKAKPELQCHRHTPEGCQRLDVYQTSPTQGPTRNLRIDRSCVFFVLDLLSHLEAPGFEV